MQLCSLTNISINNTSVSKYVISQSKQLKETSLGDGMSLETWLKGTCIYIAYAKWYMVYGIMVYDLWYKV